MLIRYLLPLALIFACSPAEKTFRIQTTNTTGRDLLLDLNYAPAKSNDVLAEPDAGVILAAELLISMQEVETGDLVYPDGDELIIHAGVVLPDDADAGAFEALNWLGFLNDRTRQTGPVLFIVVTRDPEFPDGGGFVDTNMTDSWSP